MSIRNWNLLKPTVIHSFPFREFRNVRQNLPQLLDLVFPPQKIFLTASWISNILNSYTSIRSFHDFSEYSGPTYIGSFSQHGICASVDKMYGSEHNVARVFKNS